MENMEIMSIKGGWGFRRLMEKIILNFHFDYWNPSQRFLFKRNFQLCLRDSFPLWGGQSEQLTSPKLCGKYLISNQNWRGVKTYSPPQGTLVQQCIAGLDHWSMISSGAAVVRLEQDGNKTATSQGDSVCPLIVDLPFIWVVVIYFTSMPLHLFFPDRSLKKLYFFPNTKDLTICFTRLFGQSKQIHFF